MPGSDIIQRIVTPPPPAPPGLHLLIGPKGIRNLVLYSLAGYLHTGRRVYWIDAGNRFDAYGLGITARAARLDERRVLAHVHLARPFTAIQMSRMLERQVPRIPAGCPVILSDPMALFYDPEMPEDEVDRIFRGFISAVRGLESPVLGLAVARPAPETRRQLSKRLVREARSVAEVRGLGEGAVPLEERFLGARGGGKKDPGRRYPSQSRAK